MLFRSDGKSQRQIAKEVGISRDTIKKYIDEYEANLIELDKAEKGDETQRVDIIDEIVKAPRYKSSRRQKRVLTDEVIDRIKYYLKENECKRLKGLSKQQKKKKDIYEALINEGFQLSYPSVAQEIGRIERKEREAFIKQDYNLGEVTEFDWGTVKIYVEGVLREYQMAVFTSA